MAVRLTAQYYIAKTTSTRQLASASAHLKSCAPCTGPPHCPCVMCAAPVMALRKQGGGVHGSTSRRVPRSARLGARQASPGRGAPRSTSRWVTHWTLLSPLRLKRTRSEGVVCHVPPRSSQTTTENVVYDRAAGQSGSLIPASAPARRVRCRVDEEPLLMEAGIALPSAICWRAA